MPQNHAPHEEKNFSVRLSYPSEPANILNHTAAAEKKREVFAKSDLFST